MTLFQKSQAVRTLHFRSTPPRGVGCPAREPGGSRVLACLDPPPAEIPCRRLRCCAGNVPERPSMEGCCFPKDALHFKTTHGVQDHLPMVGTNWNSQLPYCDCNLKTFPSFCFSTSTDHTKHPHPHWRVGRGLWQLKRNARLAGGGYLDSYPF